MVRLTDLLKDHEKAEINGRGILAIDIQQDVTALSLGELNNIGLLLMRTEYWDEKIPNCFIPAEALNILLNRAKKLNAKVF
jgi:hypothetical protein